MIVTVLNNPQLLFLSLVVISQVALAVNVSSLASHLQSLSVDIFPGLKDIAIDVWENPEIGLDEHHAHDLVVEYFTEKRPKEWKVTPHAYGLPTAWKLETEIRTHPISPKSKLPAIGFLAEYDALVGIGHACGHNHILLNGLTAASLTRQALIDLKIPARIVVIGTPDEENEAGKHLLQQAGAFNDIDIWLIAHPTSTNAIQPMNARINAITTFTAPSHAEAVRKAYEALVLMRDRVAQGLPGTSSSVVPVEDVGMFESNVVQSQISLGIRGTTVESITYLVSSILDTTYPGVTFTATEDLTTFPDSPNNINLTVFGPGGHASENTKSPLVLTIETFRSLTASPAPSPLTFYLPGNTTSPALSLTFDIRSRYTHDLPAVLSLVTTLLSPSASSISTDTIYPALEVTPFLPDLFTSIITTPPYESQDFPISTFAPASTDASWIQNARVDPNTKMLLGADKVVFHPNFGICEPGSGACPFNHEPGFREVAGTEYSYGRTEIVARALAHMAVLLVGDEGVMREAVAVLGGRGVGGGERDGGKGGSEWDY